MNKRSSHILSAVLDHLKNSPTVESVGIKGYRNLLEKSAAVFKPNKSIVIEPLSVNGIKAQWLTPPRHHKNRIIMYTHGGGYIAGSILSHQDLASRIAIASQARVLIFNYRLAPEHPFPQGLEDVKAVYRWLTGQYGKPHHISLIGDSAGAGLTLALLSLLLKKGHLLPDCTVLISPWIDLECKNTSHIENQKKDPMLSQGMLKRTARLYTDKPLSDPLISPINGDFCGSCPVLIHVGENEVLMDDATLLAKKLEAAGVDVQLEIGAEMFHVWHYFAKYLRQGRQAIEQIGNFVKTHG